MKIFSTIAMCTLLALLNISHLSNDNQKESKTKNRNFFYILRYDSLWNEFSYLKDIGSYESTYIYDINILLMSSFFLQIKTRCCTALWTMCTALQASWQKKKIIIVLAICICNQISDKNSGAIDYILIQKKEKTVLYNKSKWYVYR